MASTKQFICLANSVKTGGCRIAGKVVNGKTLGPWLRRLLCTEEKPHYHHRVVVAEYVKGKWDAVEIEHIP